MTKTKPAPAAGTDAPQDETLRRDPDPQWSSRVSAAMLARLAARAAVAGGGATMSVEAPFTGETLGEVPKGTPADVAAACAKARAAQAEALRASAGHEGGTSCGTEPRR